MSDESDTHEIVLTANEMQTILETINKTGYAGIHSNIISSIREKMTLPEPEEKE